MFRRLFWTAVGVGAGAAAAMWAARKVERAQRRLAPGQLAASAGARASGWRDRWLQAVREGRSAAAAREAELRAIYRVRQAPPPAGGAASHAAPANE